MSDELKSNIVEQLGLLIEDTGALIAVYDRHDRLRYANTAFRESYFVDPEEGLTWIEIVRRNYHHNRGTVISDPDFEAWASSVVSRRGKVSQRSFETDMLDGRWIFVVETVQPDGWMLYVGTDVTDMRVSDRDLRHDRDLALIASGTDELTGISNRRHIMMLLQQVISGENASQEQSGCVCIMDIDFFKRINDEFGHQIGDSVLCVFSKIVRRTVRLADGLGRIGGEEFILVMPDVTLYEAVDILNRVFAAIRNARMIAGQSDRRVTFSAGLTSMLPNDTVNDIYSRADQALFRAKENGRDQLQIEQQT